MSVSYVIHGWVTILCSQVDKVLESISSFLIVLGTNGRMQSEVMAPKNLHQTQKTNPETAPERKRKQRPEENKNNVEHRERAMTSADPG